MPCAIEHMLDYNFTKYTYFSTIPIIRDFFGEIFLPCGNTKRVASCIKKKFGKKGPLWKEKKKLNLPYLNHRFLYVSMVWKKINLVNDFLVNNCWIHLLEKIRKKETHAITILYTISLKVDFYFYWISNEKKIIQNLITLGP